jgi:hypothetical protein
MIQKTSPSGPLLSKVGSWDSREAIPMLQGLRQLDRYGETATALGITAYRARQKWTYARAWLRDALGN